MKKYRFLLVDPNSVFHGPPKEIRGRDKSLATMYSTRLDNEINERLNIQSDSNWNAISTNMFRIMDC